MGKTLTKMNEPDWNLSTTCNILLLNYKKTGFAIGRQMFELFSENYMESWNSGNSKSKIGYNFNKNSLIKPNIELSLYFDETKPHSKF